MPGGEANAIYLVDSFSNDGILAMLARSHRGNDR
jgi:hypothetical protein